MRLSIWRTFCACFSLDSVAALRRILSLSGAFFMALRTPWLDHSRWVRALADEVGLLRGELLVVVALLPARGRALLEVGVVAAAVDAVRVLGEVEFEHARDRSGEELAIVADEHDAAPDAPHERLEPLESVEVEVVGRLVEQHDVEARAAAARRARRGPPGRPRARSSASRPRGGRRARRGSVRARRAPRGAARRGRPRRCEPAFERDGVLVGGVWTARRRGSDRRERGRSVLEARRGLGGTPCVARCIRRSSRRRSARAPAAASRRTRRPARGARSRPAARVRRRGSAAASTCPPRSPRRRRRHRPGRP